MGEVEVVQGEVGRREWGRVDGQLEVAVEGDGD